MPTAEELQSLCNPAPYEANILCDSIASGVTLVDVHC